MLRSVNILCILLILIPLSSRGQSCNTDQFQHYNFEDIGKIFDKNGCDNCHKNQSSRWSYDTYESTFEINECGISNIKRGDAGSSTIVNIVRQLTNCSNTLLSNNHKLSSTDIKAIEAWINAGAPNGCIPSFESITDISNQNQCYGCHNIMSNESDWTLDMMTDINQKSKLDCDNKSIISIYNPDKSTLIDVVNQSLTCVANISSEHFKLSQIEIQKISDWISAGAPINSASLPLELISFKINIINSHPELLWTTASEIGVEKFIIERQSKDGRFTAIAEIVAKGEPSNYYQYIDTEVSFGEFYYRINILDYDGRHEYSPIEYIEVNSKNFVFNIYPNPSSNNSTLKLDWYSKNDIQNSAKMKLMNSAGRVLSEYKIQKGANNIPLTLLPNGIYYLTIEDYYGGTHFERLVILDN